MPLSSKFTMIEIRNILPRGEERGKKKSDVSTSHHLVWAKLWAQVLETLSHIFLPSYLPWRGSSCVAVYRADKQDVALACLSFIWTSAVDFFRWSTLETPNPAINRGLKCFPFLFLFLAEGPCWCCPILFFFYLSFFPSLCSVKRLRATLTQAMAAAETESFPDC